MTPKQNQEPESNTSIFRQLWRLSLPIIGLNVLNVLSLAVDTAMCGRLPNAKSTLTALSFATQISWLLMVLMMGLTVGTVALVARSYGAQEHDKVNHILHQATMLTLLLGVFVAGFGNLIAGPLMELLGATPAIRDIGLLYLRPLFMAAPFFYLMILLAGVLRGVGNTRLPFLVSILTNLINVAINYCLILGHFGFPALGLRGAAIGTVCSYATGMVIMVWLLRRGAIPTIKLPLKPTKIDKDLAKKFVQIGTPAAFDMVILNAAFLSIVGMLGRIDEAAVAAHGIGLRIQALAFVPGMSISQATGALVGQALGANNLEKAKQVVRSSLILCSLVMCAIAASILLTTNPLLGIFKVDTATSLGQFAKTWIQLLGWIMPAVGIHIAFVGMLQGAGETKTSLNINLISTLAFQIPMSYILGFVVGWGAFGVWLAFPLSFALKVLMDLVVYFRGDWAKVGSYA